MSVARPDACPSSIRSSCRGLSVPVATAPAAATPAALARVIVVLFPLVLQKVLGDRPEEGAADGAQEAVTGLLAQHVAAEAAGGGAQEAAVGLGHGRGAGVVVGRVRVARLRRELVLLADVVLLTGVFPGLLAAQLLLVGLVLGIGVVAAVLLRLSATAAVVALVALRVAGVVGAKLATGLAVLETAVLRRTERVLAARRAEVLIRRRVLLRVALLRRVLLLAGPVALLAVGRLAVATLLTVLSALAVVGVGIVRTRHDRQ